MAISEFTPTVAAAGGNDESVVLSLKTAEKLTGISVRVLAQALRDGALKGRNLEGRRGWVTTKNALREWAERGNVTEVTA